MNLNSTNQAKATIQAIDNQAINQVTNQAVNQATNRADMQSIIQAVY